MADLSFKAFKAIDSKVLHPIALATCLLATAPQVLATEIEKQHLYSGALDGRPLVLRIFEGRRPYPLEDLAGVTAQYFFQADGKLVTLRDSGDGWLEECGVEYHQRIQCKAGGTLWRIIQGGGDGVELVRQETGTSTTTVFPMRAIAEGASDPLCEGLEVRGKRQTMGGISFAWVTDPRSGVKVVKLLGGLPRAKLNEFNRQRSAELKKLSCEELEMLPYGGGTENKKEVQFASKRYLSVGGTVSFYSGGTTGNQSYEVDTYDLVSLKAIRAGSLFKSVRDAKPTGANGTFPLRIKGPPRNLEDLVWQEGWKRARNWPSPKFRAVEHADYSQPPFDDYRENYALYFWFDLFSTCEWDDDDRPLSCWLDSSENNFRAQLTRKGVAIVFNEYKNLGAFTIPWDKAAVVLRPGVTLK